MDISKVHRKKKSPPAYPYTKSKYNINEKHQVVFCELYKKYVEIELTKRKMDQKT